MIQISVFGKCFKGKRCVISRISYGLKWGIPWILKEHLILPKVYLIVITVVILLHNIIATGSLSRSVFW